MPIMKNLVSQPVIDLHHIQRILFYTHNSIGLGHIFRARAIITGIRHWRPDINFLVLSGTSVPHVLLQEGVEIVKLPGIEKVVGESGVGKPESSSGNAMGEHQNGSFKARYLRGVALDDIMNLRRTIIADTVRFFKPDVVIVEHYLGGLLDEMLPVLRKSRRNRGSSNRVIRVALSRGIMGDSGEFLASCGSMRTEALIKYYDFFYVFDDEILFRKCGVFDRSFPSKIGYLGKITDKRREEIASREVVYERFRLAEKPIILLSLSRFGDISGLCDRLFAIFHRQNLDRDYQIIFIIDPYLNKKTVETVRAHPLAAKVRFLPFFYPLVDIINASALVVCRGGYNIVNELLLTGAKAIVIPESHPSGEQEQRIGTIPLDNMVVLRESEILQAPPDDALLGLLQRKAVPLRFDFDKYAIGKRIITELEGCFAS